MTKPHSIPNTPTFETASKPKRVPVDARYVVNGWSLARDGIVDLKPGETRLPIDRMLTLALLEQLQESARVARGLLKDAQKRADAAHARVQTESARHALAEETVRNLERLLQLEPESEVPADENA